MHTFRRIACFSLGSAPASIHHCSLGLVDHVTLTQGMFVYPNSAKHDNPRERERERELSFSPIEKKLNIFIGISQEINLFNFVKTDSQISTHAIFNENENNKTLFCTKPLATSKHRNVGVFYIFTTIRKVTRWFSMLKRAPTDLALL